MANGKKKSKKINYLRWNWLIACCTFVIAFIGGSKEEIVSVQTEKVEKRTITQTVAATGKIQILSSKLSLHLK